MAGLDVLDLLADDPIDQIDFGVADRKPRAYQDRLDPFARYDDREFRSRYRLRKATARELIDLLDDKLSPATDRNNALSSADKVGTLLCNLCACNDKVMGKRMHVKWRVVGLVGVWDYFPPRFRGAQCCRVCCVRRYAMSLLLL